MIVYRSAPLRSCSQSLDFLNIADVDGSASGLGPNTAILGPNAMQALPTPVCSSVNAWNGIVCPGIKQRSFAVLGTGV